MHFTQYRLLHPDAGSRTGVPSRSLASRAAKQTRKKTRYIKGRWDIIITFVNENETSEMLDYSLQYSMSMEPNTTNYEPPRIEVVEFKSEQGFAQSNSPYQFGENLGWN